MEMTRRTSLPHKQPRRSGSGPRVVGRLHGSMKKEVWGLFPWEYSSCIWEYEERGFGFVNVGSMKKEVWGSFTWEYKERGFGFVYMGV